MQIFETTAEIYKRDTKGNVRVWWAEAGFLGDDCYWRTNSGIKDGKIVTSEPRRAHAKNVGRANATTAQEQAVQEMTADMNKKLERGYFTNIDLIDSFEKFKPMLASGYENHKFDFRTNTYYSQPKLDGIRCVARADGLWTRAGKPIVATPHIQEYLQVFFEKYPNAVLDGELYNHTLKDDFNKITSMVRKTKLTQQDIAESARLVQYHVYDCVLGDSDLGFADRYDFVCNQGFADPVQYVRTEIVHNTEQLDQLYGDYLTDGYEGQMIRLDCVYENKRSKFLIKRKEFLSDEFRVVDILEGQGNWSGYVKRFVLKLADGTEFGAGVRGNQDTLRKLFEDNQKPTWATLRYFTPTPDGIPRFPVVVDWGIGERKD